MNDPRSPDDILASAGFTADELRALAGGLAFAVTLSEAGEDGYVGELGGGVVDWTPQKMRALTDYVEAIRRRSQ